MTTATSLCLDVTSIEEFDSLVKNTDVVVAHFWADWAPQCADMNEIMEELALKYNKTENDDDESGSIIKFVKVEAEECAELSEREDISAVPTFIFYKNFGKKDSSSTIDGAKAGELSDTVDKLAKLALGNSKLKKLGPAARKYDV